MDDLFIKDGEDVEINFAYTTPYTDSHTTEASQDKSSDIAEKETAGKAMQPDFDNGVDNLFETEYVKLYKEFHKKSDHSEQPSNPMEVTLRIKPISSDLNRLFSFPFLSRDAVKEDTSRKEAYSDIMPFGDNRNQGPRTFFKKFFAFADKLVAERGVMQTTAIADVIVVCVESFQVKDLTTDEVIQGDGKERTIPHVIRLEMDVVMEMANGGERWVKSNWRIADIDDMVGGRNWWTPSASSG